MHPRTPFIRWDTALCASRLIGRLWFGFVWALNANYQHFLSHHCSMKLRAICVLVNGGLCCVHVAFARARPSTKMPWQWMRLPSAKSVEYICRITLSLCLNECYPILHQIIHQRQMCAKKQFCSVRANCCDSVMLWCFLGQGKLNPWKKKTEWVLHITNYMSLPIYVRLPHAEIHDSGSFVGELCSVAKRCAQFPNWWLWCKSTFRFSKWCDTYFDHMLLMLFWERSTDLLFLNYHIYIYIQIHSASVCACVRGVHSNHVPASFEAS